ncbi:MAG: ELM1/GtrOC1 family putative glycosyltransferase [Sulfurovaceae bacterium]
MKRILIVSDGRKGHLNQSIALAKYLGYEYDVMEVYFKSKILKLFSYLLDRIGVYTMSIFEIRDGLPRLFQSLADTDGVIANEVWQFKNKFENYNIAVCAGSSTYYAAKVIAKKLNVKSISMMLPRGYRYDFDVMFAQTHDNPPKQSNIIEIPANFSFIQPLGLYKPKKRSIGIVIGGNNSYLEIDKDKLKSQLDFIKKQFKDFEIAITSSPRTPKEIEDFIKSYHFDYEVIYSQNPINPIPDFLAHCDTVFITSDSTSMISEIISFGEANVVILPLRPKKSNKFDDLISRLEADGYLHIFNGKIINKNKKIDFRRFVKGINL